jgi:hypothetical protein
MKPVADELGLSRTEMVTSALRYMLNISAHSLRQSSAESSKMHSASIQRYLRPNSRVTVIASWKLAGSSSYSGSLGWLVVVVHLATTPQQCERAAYFPDWPLVSSNTTSLVVCPTLITRLGRRWLTLVDKQPPESWCWQHSCIHLRARSKSVLYEPGDP